MIKAWRTASEGIEQLVRASDILVAATNSMTPIVKTAGFRLGVDVNIIGADGRPRIELEARQENS